MKKTKIICTMGPNTNDRNLMKHLPRMAWTSRVSISPTVIMKSRTSRGYVKEHP